MFKIYTSKNEFVRVSGSLNLELIKNINDCFTKNNYMISLENDNQCIVCYKGETDDFATISGEKDLVKDITKNIISLGLEFKSVTVSRTCALEFVSSYCDLLGGDFLRIDESENDIHLKYEEKNIESCVLAGGCFWCMSKPYYEYDGIKLVYSGYSGGEEVLPKYEEVKAQLTSHKECVKLIYDKTVLSYKEILDIYFETIDPFDDGGQFIDRGLSYTCAIYYNNEEMYEMIKKYVFDFEKQYKRKVVVEILPEKVFYMAEEYHQDFALKNPEEMEKELIESGRKKG